jgi:hypothetical protein
LVSQPSSGAVAEGVVQLPKGAAQVGAHLAAAQFTDVVLVVEQVRLQPPQFARSLTDCSQPVLASPSQSPNPLLQFGEHMVDLHVAVAFAKVAQGSQPEAVQP